MYWRRKNSMEGKSYVFSDWKQRSKVGFLYFEFKLRQDRHGWCFSELKCSQMVEWTYLGTSKQQTKRHWCFKIPKCLQKGNNSIFRLCEITSKVQCMYLAFENLIISTKKSEQSSESQQQSTINDFPGKNSTR